MSGHGRRGRVVAERTAHGVVDGTFGVGRAVIGDDGCHMCTGVVERHLCADDYPIVVIRLYRLGHVAFIFHHISSVAVKLDGVAQKVRREHQARGIVMVVRIVILPCPEELHPHIVVLQQKECQCRRLCVECRVALAIDFDLEVACVSVVCHVHVHRDVSPLIELCLDERPPVGIILCEARIVFGEVRDALQQFRPH